MHVNSRTLKLYFIIRFRFTKNLKWIELSQSWGYFATSPSQQQRWHPRPMRPYLKQFTYNWLPTQSASSSFCSFFVISGFSLWTARIFMEIELITPQNYHPFRDASLNLPRECKMGIGFSMSSYFWYSEEDTVWCSFLWLAVVADLESGLCLTVH